jgi:hypothetical protein
MLRYGYVPHFARKLSIDNGASVAPGGTPTVQGDSLKLVVCINGLLPDMTPGRQTRKKAYLI